MPTSDRTLLLKAQAENKKLATENKQLAKELNTKSLLKRNSVVKTILSEEATRLSSFNKRLQEQNRSLAVELQQQKKLSTTKSLLKQNPLVQEIITQEKSSLQKELAKKTSDLDLLGKRFEELQNAQRIKPLQKSEFNRFLSSSIQELQNELSAGEGEYEFVVRELEVEANVMVESRANIPVYVLPTTEQLKDVDPRLMSRLKYALSVIPKE